MSEIKETYEMIEREWNKKILQQKESEIAFLKNIAYNLNQKFPKNKFEEDLIWKRIKQLKGGRDE